LDVAFSVRPVSDAQAGGGGWPDVSTPVPMRGFFFLNEFSIFVAT
jgi:hypothetical protein